MEEIIFKLDKILNTLEQHEGFPFFEMFFSAFLGFVVALLVEALVGAMKNKNSKKQIIGELKNELESVKGAVDILEENKHYFCPYSIPIWKGACKSGIVLSIRSIENFTKLIDVFASIEEANTVEKEALISNINFGKSNEALKNACMESRRKVKESVENGIKILTGKEKNSEKD